MDSKEAQTYFKEHNIPSLDVDWLISSKKISKKSTGRRNSTTGDGDKTTASPTIISPSESLHNQQTEIPKYRRNSIATSMVSGTSSTAHSNVAHEGSSISAHDTTELNSASPMFAAKYNERNTSNNNIPTSVPLRRTKSLSSPTAHQQAQQPEKKAGFFKSLFGRRKSTTTPPAQFKSNASSINTTNNNTNPSTSSSTTSLPKVDTKSRGSRVGSPERRPMSAMSPNITPQSSHGSASSSRVRVPPGMAPLTRAKTTSDGFESETHHVHHHHHHHHHHDGMADSEDPLYEGNNLSSDDNSRTYSNNEGQDPRLMEFLQYYKAKNYSIAAFREKNPYGSKYQRPMKASFSIDEHLAEHDEEDEVVKPKKFDAKGRPLPSHPHKSQLPSAFKKKRVYKDPCQTSAYKLKKNLDKVDTSTSTIASAPPGSPSSSKKFGAFLKRVTSYGASNDSANEVPPQQNSDIIQTPLIPLPTKRGTFDPSTAAEVPGLEEIKPLKHVAFASNTYFNDPPQQICSKNPRKGEVEVKSNGSVIIHRLTPQERRKILKESSCGIVVGGSGQLKLLVPDDEIDQNVDLKKAEEQIPNKKQDEEVAEKPATEETDPQLRSIKLAAAEAAAEARAKATPNELSRTTTNNEEEVGVSRTASHLTIDKPMVSRRSSNNLSSANSLNSLISHVSEMSDNKNLDEEPVFPPPNLKIPHDVVYTRCCHLREILPIPATLKQLKAGSTDPIPLLQLRNPRPSMVEVLSFSDFISVAPILCISLDGVHLTVEMLKVILSSLLVKPGFEKLSLRNTPLDEKGWKVLSYFISKCKSISALDLTMVPNVKTNVQKPSKSSLKNVIPRMESRMEDRSDMNWHILSAAIAFRGGIEEIILAGAKMTFSQFKTFIEVACMNATRLGLAYNELTSEECVVLAHWIVHSKVTGLDIGFNDLRGKMAPFYDAIWDKINNKGEKNVFKYLSLNGTNMEVKENDTSETNDFLKLLSIMCFSENLKFIDLSNNPNIFPYCLPTLVDCLPVFVNLIRLHLDYDNLSRTAVVTLAEALPLCRRLNHLSLVGTELDLASCKALVEAVKKSSSLITIDIDWAYMPDNIKEKLSLYAMRNIQKELSRLKETNAKKRPDFINNKNKSNREEQQLQTIQDELANLLTEDWSHTNKEEYSRMVSEFITKVTKGREKIQKVVMDLFLIRLQGELNFEGKETLIRLCIIDASLEKGLKLLKKRHYGSHPTPLDSRDVLNQSIEPVEKSLSDISLMETRDAVLSSTTFGKSGHSALLPFGRANIERAHISTDDTVEFTEEAPSELVAPKIKLPSETDSSSSDSTTLNENNNNNNNNKGGEDPEIHHKISQEEKMALTKAAESMDSDQIKDFLLKSDVNTVIGVIDELHKHGYHLHHIFKNAHPRLNSVATEDSEGRCTPPIDVNTKIGDLIPKDSADMDKFAATQETEAIDAAYDQVLDHLQTIRSKKHPDMKIEGELTDAKLDTKPTDEKK